MSDIKIKIPAFERWIKNPTDARVITFDPGQTTGYAKWEQGKLIEAAQLDTHDVQSCVGWLKHWVHDAWDYRDAKEHKIAVLEEYRIYQWKTEQHAWSDVHTLRLIGALEALLTLENITIVFQGAGLAKGFCDDDRLRAWGFYERGQRHARDAIRHGCYFYCTAPKKS